MAKDLAPVDHSTISARRSADLSVGMLERKLLELFPADQAEPWDVTGLTVGDASLPVSGVAVALDATPQAIEIARSCGANILVTHHPVCLEPPRRLSATAANMAEEAIWDAVKQDVALMDFHTALDVSPQAGRMLPGMLSLKCLGVLDRLERSDSLGYGQICGFSDSEESLPVSSLASRCLAVFGRTPRVWGDMDRIITKVATCTGSASTLPRQCLEAGIPCLICGEIHYHDALDASQQGLAIIELGHDVSELPLCAVLASALEDCGISRESITMIDQSENWTTPEAIRK